MTGTSGCMDHQAGQGKAPQACPTTPGQLPTRPGRPAWVAGHGPSLPDRTTVAGAAQVRRTRLLATIHRGCMHACRRRTPSCFPLNCKARKRPASTNRAILRGPEKIFRRKTRAGPCLRGRLSPPQAPWILWIPSAARPPRRRPAWASRAPGPRCRSPRTARRAGGSRGCHRGCRRSSRACRPKRPSSTAPRYAAR